MSKLFSIKLMILIIAALIVSYVVPMEVTVQAASAKTFNLKYAALHPEQNEMNVAPKLWMKAVEERTKGRVKFKAYFSQTLGKQINSLDMLRTGICDVCEFPSITFTKEFPVTDILAIPGLVPRRAVCTEIVYTLYHRGLLDKELADYKPIIFQGFDQGLLLLRDKRVTKLEDLKGMKIRYQSNTTKMALEALGATTISIPGPDLYVALNTGILDGAVVTPAYFTAIKLCEVAKHVLLDFSLHAGTVFVFMSQKTWNSLPADIQLIMEELIAKAHYQHLEAGRVAEIQANKIMREAGMDMYKLSPDEFKRWMEKIKPIEDWVLSDLESKGLPGKEAFETAKQVGSMFGF